MGIKRTVAGVAAVLTGLDPHLNILKDKTFHPVMIFVEEFRHGTVDVDGDAFPICILLKLYLPRMNEFTVGTSIYNCTLIL